MHKLIIDSRETSKLFECVEMEAKKQLLLTEKQWLEIGDYVYSDVCFEAKSSIDFLQSVINQRLWNQVDNMDRCFEHCIVIIHGSIHEAMDYSKYTKMKISKSLLHNKFYGAIGKLTLDTDCKVFWVESPRKAAKLITTICKMRPIQRDALRPSLLKRITTEDLRLDMLLTIKGVSETKAKRLIRQFGSIMEIGEANISEITQIEGLGATVAQRIIDTLNSENKVKI